MPVICISGGASMSNQHATSPAETGEVLVLLGAAFAVLGGWLVAMGSTPYFVIAGFALIASGTLMVRSCSAGLWSIFCTLIVALVWSVTEAGRDECRPMPRLLLLALLGIWFYLNIVVRHPAVSRPVRIVATVTAIVYALAIMGMLSPKVPMSVAKHLRYLPAAPALNSASSASHGD